MKLLYSILTLFLVSSGISFGQSARLSGIILDKKDNEAIPMATVSLLHSDTVVKMIVTDFDGNFAFENLSFGHYTLKAVALGYSGSKKEKIHIKKSSDNKHFIKLSPVKLTEIKEPEWRYFTIQDSLGNTWCIDAFVNKTDTKGLKQGVWKEYFRDYSDTASSYKIGQIVWTGHYKDDKQDGEWKYFSPDGKITRIEIYKLGQLIDVQK